MTSKINAILVDDDLQNLELLKIFLTKYLPFVNIVGEAGTLEDTVKLVNEVKPQLIYLDIQIKDRTAFELLDEIDFTDIEIIFVTAYSDFALKAFKYNAVDYVVKPIGIEDIVLASNKVFMKLKEKRKFNKLINKEIEREKLQNSLPATPIPPVNDSPHLTISSLNNIVILKKVDILFCKSEGRYTIFFLKNNVEHVSSKNLGEYDAVLGGDSFLRIHHSYIVNINHIVNINKRQGFYCEMTNGALLPISRRKKDNLMELLRI